MPETNNCFQLNSNQLRIRLKDIVENRNTKLGLYFDIFIQAFILVSIISFSIQTLPGLSDTFIKILFLIEVISVVVFTIEYFLRIFVADNKLKYIFSFFGLIDLFAILPFFISRAIDLRAIRIFRLLRLLRILKLFRYNAAAKRFMAAILSIKYELILFIFVTGFMLFFSSVGIYYFEREAQPETFQSIFHCLWWAIVTLTTVGYGDVFPVTIGGKIFTSFILLLGLGMIAVPTGLFASALTKTLKKDE